jgi:glycosyltransferase involved in cell wall biosynthesis
MPPQYGKITKIAGQVQESIPVRILIDSRMLYGQKRGIEYYLEHLILALAKIDTQNQYTLFYVSGRADKSRMMRVDARNFETKAMHFPNPQFVRLFQDSSVPYRLMRRIRWGWDVVHEPGFEPLPLAPRSVLTLHDLIFFRVPDQLPPDKLAYYQRRLRESAHNAAVVVTDSEHTRRDAIELLDLPPEKVRTVLLGVSPKAFEVNVTDDIAHQELAALGITRPFLLSIGDFYRRKNYLTALKAYALLPKDVRENCQYVFAGAQVDTSLAAEMQSIISAEGLEQSVLMPGYVSHAARRALMTRASALVYPSTYDGLPPLEAMACGVPTISSGNSSLPEVVGDAGLLVTDYLEPEAWAEAMICTLTDESLRQMFIEKGKARARTFTWERTARETLKAYELAAAS